MKVIAAYATGVFPPTVPIPKCSSQVCGIMTAGRGCQGMTNAVVLPDIFQVAETRAGIRMQLLQESDEGMMMNNEWPKQNEVLSFYGNPRNASFEGENIVTVKFPWLAVTAWNSEGVIGARVHHKCAASLARILSVIWEASGRSQDKINEWGMNKYGGGYVLRQMRGGKTLSMHSYGCAVDFDPSFNAMGDPEPHFRECPVVLQAFENEGWTWGGNWQHPDGMHWQAARI